MTVPPRYAPATPARIAANAVMAGLQPAHFPLVLAAFDALNAPETKSRFALLLAEPVASTPAQFGAFMKSELGKYEQVVKATGAKVD
jgi:tripartite-type tricarboxylate transporter receptor subunit TctC